MSAENGTFLLNLSQTFLYISGCCFGSMVIQPTEELYMTGVLGL